MFCKACLKVQIGVALDVAHAVQYPMKRRIYKMHRNQVSCSESGLRKLHAVTYVSIEYTQVPSYRCTRLLYTQTLYLFTLNPTNVY